MNQLGRFLVVEGLEGAGKSTALDTIKCCITPFVSELVITREPGGTVLGELIREIIKSPEHEHLHARAELLLFYAARIQLVEQVIRPALQRGAWVLADRFELSSFAYQGGGRGLSRDFIAQLSAFALCDIKPDLTIFLDISPEQGLQRALARGKMDRIEQESLAFFNAVTLQYHEEIAHYPHVECIDASQPLLQVQETIVRLVTPFVQSHAG
jgi:dTMP kinase